MQLSLPPQVGLEPMSLCPQWTPELHFATNMAGTFATVAPRAGVVKQWTDKQATWV